MNSEGTEQNETALHVKHPNSPFIKDNISGLNQI